MRPACPTRILGQVDFESCPLIRLAVYIDKTIVLPDDAINHGKPETCALADFLGGEKGFEQVVQNFLVHAAAVVADRQHDIFAGNKTRPGGTIRFVEDNAFGLDGDLADAVDGIPGIDAEIDQNLVDLRRVDINPPHISPRQPGQINILAYKPP